MRSISGTLEAAQKAASSTPYIRIRIGGHSYSSRLLQLEHREEAYRDSATIVLRNNDRALDDVDFIGEYFEIGYGHKTGAGNEYSNAPGLWVKSQQFLSMQGVLTCMLQCQGMWGLLGEMRVMIGGDPPAYDITYDRTHTVYELIEAVLAAVDFDVSLVESDGIIDSFKPLFNINELPYETAAAVLYRLISMTKCYLRPKSSKAFEIVYPQESDSRDEVYYSDKGHYFFENIESVNLLVPNSIVVFCNQGEDGSWESLITGIAKDDDAIAAYGYEIIECHQAANINNQSDANARASAILTRLNAEVLAGRLLVPHDARVELYDRVAVYDSRGA